MSAADDTLPAAGAPESSSAVAFAPGNHVAGRYRIVRFIASGAMGEVYAAEDLIVGGEVALKAVRPELERSAMAMERLRREIMLARKVTHAHICRLHDVGEHEGRVFITMELLSGKTLSEVVAERGALPVAEVTRIARQLVDGLAALHAHGIVHRDFKTSNVMLVGERAVITDFGLARSIQPDAMASLTVEAAMLGTPAYMAPEQVEGRPATPASDIYALGVVLFELLTGTVPFREDTALATATARLQRDPPRPSSVRAGISASWDARVLCCLARDPEARFARAVDVLDAPVPRRPSRRWFLAATGAGIAGIGAGAWRLFGGGDAAGPVTADDRVAVLPVAGTDPIGLAITVDLNAALATSALPILALDAATMFAHLDGTAVRLAKEADPVAAAFAIANVAAVVTVELARREPLELAVTLRRRRGAGWTARFEGALADAPVVVEKIAQRIAHSLGTYEVRHAADAVPFAAYGAYATALAALFDVELTEPAKASTMLTDSVGALEAFVATHQGFARAHAWLAQRLVDVGQETVGPQALELFRRARAQADRALAIDADQSCALAARGRAAMYLWDWRAADLDTRRAVELAPTDARTTLTRAYYLSLVGSFTESIAMFEGNLSRNPLAPSAIGGIGWCYYYGRRYQRAIDTLAPLVTETSLAQPGGPEVATWLVLSYVEMSQFPEALALAVRLRAVTEDPYLLATVVSAYVTAGRLDDARAIVEEVKPTGHPYLTAIALDAIGDTAGALPLLERIVDEHSDRAVYLKIERFSAALRSTPRFQALLARVGFP